MGHAAGKAHHKRLERTALEPFSNVFGVHIAKFNAGDCQWQTGPLPRFEHRVGRAQRVQLHLRPHLGGDEKRAGDADQIILAR